jgi:hypothetical protein
VPVTLAFNDPRCFPPAADPLGRFRLRPLLQRYRHPGNFQMQVDPVKQRAGQLGPVFLDLLQRAGAFALVAGAVKAAGTRVNITT